MTKTILSYGAGKDSTAILALHLNRDRAAELLGISRQAIDAALPQLDAIVFADTGAELASTYENVTVAGRLAAEAGIQFSIVRHKESIVEHNMRLGTLPMMPNSPHTCSIKFKQDAITSWKRNEFAGEDTQMLIGYEANEVSRCSAAAGSFSPAKGEINLFPLIELGITRDMADTMLKVLWPITVSKSSCVYCPFMRLEEVENVYRTDKAAWQMIRDLEDAFRAASHTKHQAFVAADAAWRAGEGESPYVRKGGETWTPEMVDAAIDAGEKLPSARTGMWKRDSWAEGTRVFWGIKFDGKPFSMDELEAHFAG